MSWLSGLSSLWFDGFLSFYNWCSANGSCSSSSTSSTSATSSTSRCCALDSSFVWTFSYLTAFSVINYTSCWSSTTATSSYCWLRFWLSTFSGSTWNDNFDIFFKFDLTLNRFVLWRRLALNNFVANWRFRLIFRLIFYFLLFRELIIFIGFLLLRWNFFLLRSSIWIFLFRDFYRRHLILLRSISIFLILWFRRALFLLWRILRLLFLLRTLRSFIFYLNRSIWSFLFILSNLNLWWRVIDLLV